MQSLQGHDITIYGDGSQTRCFCYVDDLIEAMVRMMGTPEEFTGPVNIGSTSEFTIRELAEKIIELTGSSSKIVYRALPSDDPVQRRPDVALAQEHLGWEPTTPWDIGLRSTIEYFRRTYDF
jgi:UDP-glucuronate decarboxylase